MILYCKLERKVNEISENWRLRVKGIEIYERKRTKLIFRSQKPKVQIYIIFLLHRRA